MCAREEGFLGVGGIEGEGSEKDLGPASQGSIQIGKRVSVCVRPEAAGNS